MINSTVEFDRELQNDNRDYFFDIYIRTKSNDNILITEKNLWENSVTFTEGTSSSDSFDLGSAIVGQCKFVINDIYEEFDDYDFFNATFTLDIGLKIEGSGIEYIRKGIYTVTSAEYNGSLITITALDNMWKFDVPFSEITGITYPLTAIALVSRICTYCNVTLASYTFNFASFYLIEPIVNGEMNCREVLSYIGQICCVYFKINTEGALAVSWYDKSQINEQTNVSGGSFSTTTSPYTDGDSLNGGTFQYGQKSVENVISSSNASNFFTVTNEYYYFRLTDNTWYATNTGVNSSLAYTKFVAKYNGTVKFNWNCTSEENYDYFSVLKNTTELLKTSGIGKSGTISIDVSAGDSIALKYYKDSTSHASGESVTVSNFIFKSEGEDVYDGGTFLGFNGIAYLTSNKQMSVGTDEIIVTGVQTLNKDDEDGYDYTSGTSGYVLVIENNPFVNKFNYEQVANNVASVVVGFEIRTFEASTLSNPKWQSGDACAIVDFKGRRFYSFITNLTFQSGSYEKASLGAITPTEQKTVRYSDAVKTAVALARKQVNEKLTDYDKIVQNMNSLAVNAMGLRWAEVFDRNGNSVFYMSNAPIAVNSDSTSATFTVGSKLWKMTGSGFFCCLSAQSTDAQCAWTNGWDSNGNVVVNTLSTIGLTFDWAYGGTLTLGGSNNQHGKLAVNNASGTQVGSWDKDGITITNELSSGSICSIKLGNVKNDSNMLFYLDDSLTGSISCNYLRLASGSLLKGLDMYSEGRFVIEGKDHVSIYAGNSSQNSNIKVQNNAIYLDCDGTVNVDCSELYIKRGRTVGYGYNGDIELPDGRILSFVNGILIE